MTDHDTKLQRVRNALIERPDLLRNLVTGLREDPPRILGPWEPDLLRVDQRLLVIRRDLFGEPFIYIEPQNEGGFQGPWEVRIWTDEWKDRLTEAERALFAGSTKFSCPGPSTEDTPFKLSDMYWNVDRALESMGFALATHTYPHVVFEPWSEARPGLHRRVVQRFDPHMDERFAVTAMNGSWEIFEAPGQKTEEFDHRGLETNKTAADRALIKLGYNLARPESFEGAPPKIKGTLGPWKQTPNRPDRYHRYDQHGRSQSEVKRHRDGTWTNRWSSIWGSCLDAQADADKRLRKAGWALVV